MKPMIKIKIIFQSSAYLELAFNRKRDEVTTEQFQLKWFSATLFEWSHQKTLSIIEKGGNEVLAQSATETATVQYH